VKLVVDASVAIKWVVAEEGRAEALDRAAGAELIAPDFVLIECANILWKKVRLGQVSSSHAHDGLAFVQRGFSRLLPTHSLIPAAMSLAIEMDHPVYDCLYLACAEHEGITLLTADRRLAGRAGRRSDRIQVLGQQDQ
jgi:predicted nucleic acid-binding protein